VEERNGLLKPRPGVADCLKIAFAPEGLAMSVRALLLSFVTLLLLAGCASKTRRVRVELPPRVDLRAYPLVGLVNFSANASGDLDRLGTEKFLQAVQQAQPGTRVVELGSEEQVLASVGGHAWDPTTLRAIKEKHNVDVIVLGRIDVERAKADFELSTVIKRLSVRQDVNASLTTKMLETGSGATMWSDAGQLTAEVAHASFNSRGQGHFGASDPEAAYGAMLDGLVCQVTEDFQPRYTFRRVPRDQTAVAVTE
jgi:hypothetical protein